MRIKVARIAALTWNDPRFLNPHLYSHTRKARIAAATDAFRTLACYPYHHKHKGSRRWRHVTFYDTNGPTFWQFLMVYLVATGDNRVVAHRLAATSAIAKRRSYL
jgi:hypothetical protein